MESFDRGDLTGSPPSGISRTPAVAEDWTLDQLGNWQAFDQDDDGDGSADLVQTRSHNVANEVGTIAASTGTNWADPAYDAAGNMTSIPWPSLLSYSYSDCQYDAWNRLVSVDDGGGSVDQQNQYDGLHRRIVRGTYSYSTTTHFYYNENWQCLEERTNVGGSPQKQYVWHPYYIDALAVSYTDDGGGVDTHYYTHDANFNVTGLIDSGGDVLERYHYTPYGVATYLEDDFDVAPTQESTIDNEFLFTGRRLDPVTGLYQYRYRYYHAQLGRFLTRDPIGYLAGSNLYEYVRGKPTQYLDPMGTKETKPNKVTGRGEVTACFECRWKRPTDDGWAMRLSSPLI